VDLSALCRRGNSGEVFSSVFDQNCDIIIGRAALGINFDIGIGWAA
jgi:hypothetical protein